jgi:hypothetical protein
MIGGVSSSCPTKDSNRLRVPTIAASWDDAMSWG